MGVQGHHCQTNHQSASHHPRMAQSADHVNVAKTVFPPQQTLSSCSTKSTMIPGSIRGKLRDCGSCLTSRLILSSAFAAAASSRNLRISSSFSCSLCVLVRVLLHTCVAQQAEILIHSSRCIHQRCLTVVLSAATDQCFLQMPFRLLRLQQQPS